MNKDNNRFGASFTEALGTGKGRAMFILATAALIAAIAVIKLVPDTFRYKMIITIILCISMMSGCSEFVRIVNVIDEYHDRSGQ